MYISFIVLGIGEGNRDGLTLTGLFYMAPILWGGLRPYKRMYFSQIFLAVEINSLIGRSWNHTPTWIYLKGEDSNV